MQKVCIKMWQVWIDVQLPVSMRDPVNVLLTLTIILHNCLSAWTDHTTCQGINFYWYKASSVGRVCGFNQGIRFSTSKSNRVLLFCKILFLASYVETCSGTAIWYVTCQCRTATAQDKFNRTAVEIFKFHGTIRKHRWTLV